MAPWEHTTHSPACMTWLRTHRVWMTPQRWIPINCRKDRYTEINITAAWGTQWWLMHIRALQTLREKVGERWPEENLKSTGTCQSPQPLWGWACLLSCDSSGRIQNFVFCPISWPYESRKGKPKQSLTRSVQRVLQMHTQLLGTYCAISELLLQPPAAC